MSSSDPDPPCSRFSPARPTAVVVSSDMPYGIGGCSDTTRRRPEGAALLRLDKKVRRHVAAKREIIESSAGHPPYPQLPSAKFRIPIFGYCPKSPEPEHSSGSGPEFRDP